VLTLIRRSSATTRGKTTMASRTGNGTETFTSSSCFCLASIIATLKGQADISRFSVLNLMPSNSVPERNHFNQVISPNKDRLLTPSNCDSFLMRSITNIDALLQSIAVYKQAMTEHGLNSRTQDQYSALLAGAHLYKSTQPITYEEAQKELSAFNFDIFEPEAAPQEEESVFMYILSASLSVKDDPSANSRTIGWMIQHVMENQFSHGDGDVMKVKTAIEILKEWGIKVCHATQNVYFLRSSTKIRGLLKHNPQWYHWHKIVLDDIHFQLHKDNMRFGVQVGFPIYAPFSFFRDGVSFSSIKPMILSEDDSTAPF
jgi:hypothetical protein